MGEEGEGVETLRGELQRTQDEVGIDLCPSCGLRPEISISKHLFMVV